MKKVYIHHSGIEGATFESIKAFHSSYRIDSVIVSEEEFRERKAKKDGKRFQRPWVDIGYHVVIENDGKIKLGRYILKRGAHVQGDNEGTIGICVCGNYNKRTITEVVFDSLLTWLVSVRNCFGEIEILGHRDFAKTSCPGDYLYVLLPDLRVRVDHYYLRTTINGWNLKNQTFLRGR